jgi:hypothetical protein
MIIPISSQVINIGDKVLNIKEIKDAYYIIPPGHEFKVIDYIKNYSRFVCEDFVNNLIIQIYKTEVTKKIDLQSARKEYVFNQETYKYLKYIFEKCPNTDYEYSDRDKYDTCKLKKWPEYRTKSCVPNLECAKFLKIEDINMCPELVKHLRRTKLEKLNKICLH